MKTSVLLCLLFGIMLLTFVHGQTAQTASPTRPSAQNRLPEKKADIVSFHVEDKGQGTLHIIYSDGTEAEIPKERGRFAVGDQTLTQEHFLDIQVADDRRHIGWLADYMICAQSYPCTAELVIYHSGHKPKYIPPPYGIMWRWKFLEGGKQIVVQGGFPHGDDMGAYALYDAETGRQLAKFSSKEEGSPPNWVQQLRRLNANSELSCISVHTPDLQNANINDINFRQGKAYTSDGSSPKDWEHTLSTDQILKPTTNREIRLIVINSNHLTGSGARDTVIAFDCVRGTLKKIFEKKYLYGVNIKIGQDDELLLTSGEWQPTDPTCCPSKEKIETYQWNQLKGTYLLKRTVIRKAKNNQPH